MITIILLVVALIYSIAERKVHKAGDLCIGISIFPSIFITDKLWHRFFIGGNNSSGTYYYSINGVKGMGSTDSLSQIVLWIFITGIIWIILWKLGELISKQIFKKEKDGNNYEKLASNMMLIASIIVGLVGIFYIYLLIRYGFKLQNLIYGAILITISAFQLKKNLKDKDYQYKNIL